MIVLLALVLAIFAGIAKAAKMPGVAKIFGIIAMVVFVGWLASGPGFAVVDFLINPKVEIPDSVPIPGQK